ncbi:type I-B CRISPR-associated protein Cas7/Cst2/DevR [Thermococcus indicus]|uniref:Type I-B CRISPR-associated protein Cas7/Cst2/DevR n=1 Tax=Thermococcus indicus TaxID=2586643 RepID=A0A4Y5SJH4_9EURY|nr:type I-B CRISPR-associated protein Cas7/Cst2/DevR [Thermococcus indicus]QDA31028.1 type I-B CRISPR-associated protein Cas7/Cst2/DevR [Thermococcus indicus]
MSRFLVMDVVFYGSSLNYDQGSGNYQELKKITRWDGRQYTLVSKYALRYSMLNDSGVFGRELAPGEVFIKDTGEKSKGDVFNPKPDVLFSGEILKYPEFDLFGYLITKSEPTQSRTAPVRISHAVSMTPFYYDSHFNGNHWIAQRALKAGLTTKLEPNLFTVEEHYSYYIYTIVVDVDNVGKLSVFTTKMDDVKTVLDNLKAKGENAKKIEEYRTFFESNGKGKKKGNKESALVNPLTLNSAEGKLEIAGVELEELKIIPIVDPTSNKKEVKVSLYEIQFDLGEEARRERVLKLVKAVLNLKRKIKGRTEFLAPELLILGIYKDKPYDSFKNRIQLLGEFEEEEYVEVEEKNGKIVKKIRRITTGENGTEEYIEEIVETKPENSGEKTVQVKRRRSVSRKRTAIFEITGISSSTPIYEYYNDDTVTSTKEKTKEHNSGSNDNKKEIHPISMDRILNLLGERLSNTTKEPQQEIFIVKSSNVEVRLK